MFWILCVLLWLPLVACGAEPKNAPSPGDRVTFVADERWRPIEWVPARIEPGSALDFSRYRRRPAGDLGPMVCRGERFAFSSALDKPLRFYGTVISHALPFIDKPQCDQLTDYLAASGYGAVRLHCYHFKPGVMKEVGSTEFSPEALDQLDYFFHSLRQRGIYYTVSINNWGFFKAGDVRDVTEFRDRGFRFESNGLLPISEDLKRWFREYSTHLFCHTNRYSGVALKDDPALLSVELTNEDSLFAVLGQHPELLPIYRDRCREELRRSAASKPNKIAEPVNEEVEREQVERELPGFILRKQQEFVDAMTHFLRELGVKQPITDLDFRDNLIYALPRSHLDYVDVHHYWALYQKLPETKPTAEPPYRHTWANPNRTAWGAFVAPAAARLFGKPFMNSEFNGCYPCPYWSFTGPVEASLAALQGWSGVYRCGQAADGTRFFRSVPIRQIGSGTNPLLMFSERIGALTYAAGQVKPLTTKLPFVVTREYLLAKLDVAGGPRYPSTYVRLAFQYQLGTLVIDEQTNLDEYPYVVVPADMQLPAWLRADKCLPADDKLQQRLATLLPQSNQRAVTLDVDRGTFQIVTPQSETFLLPAEVAEAEGTQLEVSGNRSAAVMFAGSLDDRPLKTSRRVLAMYLTDCHNTGTEIEYLQTPKENVAVLKYGKLPLLVEQGEINMRLKREGPLPRVWALRYDGARSVEISPRATADGFCFDAQAVTKPDTYAVFEVEWKE
jgi:hypothetical protein